MIILPDIKTVRIGKRGVSKEIIEEIKNILKKYGIIKVKILKNFRDLYDYKREEVAKILAKKTNSQIVEIRGFTILLSKKKKDLVS